MTAFALIYRRAAALILALSMLGHSACTQGSPMLEGAGGGSGDGVFRESFVPGQTGNWLLEQDEFGSTEIVSEQLVISVNAPNTIQYATLADPIVSDFTLEVDVRQRAGSPDSSFGVLFRLVDGSQFYRFDVTGTGSYIVERRNVDGTWSRLTPDWKTTPALSQGLNVANRLKVIANGSTMSFYANDILLEQVSDAAYTSGRIALDAGTFGSSDLQVSFDDLVIDGIRADN